MNGPRRGAGRRVAYRIAARDSRRHPWRSLLVMLLVGLPVLTASAVAVLAATFTTSPVEDAQARLGDDASAQIWWGGSEGEQPLIPWRAGFGGGEPVAEVPSLEQAGADLQRLLPDLRLTPWTEGRGGRVRFDFASVDAVFYAGDLTVGVIAERFVLERGRVPEQAGEVLISPKLAARGFAVGDTLQVDIIDAPQEVVGIATVAGETDQHSVIGTRDAFPSAASDVSWYATQGDVSWKDVERLNEAGFLALSRSVLEDPPSGVMETYGGGQGLGEEDVALIALVITMVLIEVALLTGPAFAVSARNQARTVALMTINGATPRQARRVVSAVAVLLGLVSALVGVVLGVGLARAVVAGVAEYFDESPGPFEVPWIGLVMVIVCGVASAGLAAFVPALIASRQDPIAVMAGRRTDRLSAVRGVASTVAGALVLGVGVALMTLAPTAGDFAGAVVGVIVATIITVLGMVLVIPGVVAGLGHLLRGRSFALRFAAGDAVRHRTRTVPAIAAVAATVAGVVALGIANASDGVQREKWDSHAYQPVGREALVSWRPHIWDAEHAKAVAAAWADLEDTARSGGATSVVTGRGLGSPGWTSSDDRSTRVSSTPELEAAWGPGLPLDDPLVLEEASFTAVDMVALGVASGDAERALTALREGKPLFLAASHQYRYDEWGEGEAVELPAEVALSVAQYDEYREIRVGDEVDLTATVFAVDDEVEVVASVLVPSSHPAAARSKGAPTVLATAGLRGAGLEKFGTQALALDQSFVRGVQDLRYSEPDGDSTSSRIVVLVLAIGGGLLMVVGTVTATLLALQDARPDLATLAAVGAGGKVRRRVTTAYALLISGVGAVMGALVGFVPGLSGARSLTGGRAYAVPWLELGLVVLVLPLLTALVVGLLAGREREVVQRIE